jgi:hypothetical protein
MASRSGASPPTNDILAGMTDAVNALMNETKSQARYAFRTLPDILLSGSLFLTFMLGWQPSLATFGSGIIFTGLIQSFLADFLRIKSPDLAKAGGAMGTATDPSSGHFPGTNWSRVYSSVSQPRNLVEGMVPSYYMATMGYIFSFVMAQNWIFKDELSMRPTNSQWLKIFSIITGIFVFGLGILRISVDYEPWWAALLSMLFGILVGFIFIGIVLWLFGRSAINVLHLPLLEKRVPDKKPIYVCAD